MSRPSQPTIEAERIEAIRRRSRRLSAELELDAQLAPYAAHRSTQPPTGRKPTLHVDDVSAIPFLVDIGGIEEYQHRARVRATSGDLFAASTPAARGYEAYCQDVLGLGAPELITAEPERNRLAVADGLRRGPAFERLCERARAGGGMVIHPYMGIDDVWGLAADVARVSDTPVTVLAPPPPVTWLANDKRSFGLLVEKVLGPFWLVDSRVATDAAGLAEALVALATRHERVGVKRTRCASAMGNWVMRSEDVRRRERAELVAEVEAFLTRTEWSHGEEVLVVAWESTDLSPSTQLWIPPEGYGMPRVEGIYEQILSGPERVFVGSRPSRLPAAVNRELGRAAIEVGIALQSLGYVGRCSFDHLLVGDPEGEHRLLFVECNGRWGGTSTPMSLLDRLLPSGPRPPYRAQDVVDPKLIGVPLPEILDRVGPDVFHPREGRGRFVFYNVGPLSESGKLDVIAIGSSQAEAERALAEELPRLLA